MNAEGTIPGAIGIVGSRDLDAESLTRIEWIARSLAERGHTIVSGGAQGADAAGARGSLAAAGPPPVLCLPWDGYRSEIMEGAVILYPPWPEAAMEAAISAHLYEWGSLRRGTQGLYARNGAIAYLSGGAVLAWPGNKPNGGGTGHTMRCAGILGRRVVDLSQPTELEKVLSGLKRGPTP